MDSGDSSIFISIAAYRDPQLTPTVLDCIAKAANPRRLRFGVCWQRGEEEERPPFFGQTGFRFVEVDWRQSRGACWARAEAMKLWRQEAWFLQVDSHCRFAAGWDEKLLRAAKSTGSQKPILGSYATPFTPGGAEVLRPGPLRVALQAFGPDGIPQLRPAGFRRNPPAGQPVRARFLSAGFLFTVGDFVREVPYDPDLYFMGEEIAMTVRAFTHGYDLFHPAETIVWHDYLRLDARKHWSDHGDSCGSEPSPPQFPESLGPSWSELDSISRRKVQRLLQNEPLGAFGLGSRRSLAEYEAYAGLSFSQRKAQRYTIQGDEPPNPPAAPDWAQSMYPWIVKVGIEPSQLPAAARREPAVWYLTIQDAEGRELCQLDLPAERLLQLQCKGQEAPIVLIGEFFSDSIPAAWTLWPLSRAGGWLGPVSGRLPEGDFAIVKEADEAD
jgi:hypothetical protein